MAFEKIVVSFGLLKSCYDLCAFEEAQSPLVAQLQLLEKQLYAGSTSQLTPPINLSPSRLLQPHVHGRAGSQEGRTAVRRKVARRMEGGELAEEGRATPATGREGCYPRSREGGHMQQPARQGGLRHLRRREGGRSSVTASSPGRATPATPEGGREVAHGGELAGEDHTTHGIGPSHSPRAWRGGLGWGQRWRRSERPTWGRTSGGAAAGRPGKSTGGDHAIA